MPKQALKEKITDLKTQLQALSNPKTSSSEELLTRLHDGVDHLTPSSLRDLTESLKFEIREVETEHPNITALLNQIVSSLSHLGI